MSLRTHITSFLDKLLPPDLHHLIGDLEEEFHLTKKESGLAKARIKFWGQILRSMPWFILQSLTWNSTMFLNYLKVSWRNMKRHLGFSLINVLGMAASLAVCLLMILFIIDQKSYDRFHPNKERLVRITSEIGTPVSSYATSPLSLAQLLAAQYPEVEKAVPISRQLGGSFATAGPDVSLNGMYSTPDFLSVFGYKLLQGDPATALQEPGSVVLTPETAKKLFGHEPALGKTLQKVNGPEFTVTGIIDDSPKSHISFDMVGSFSTIKANTELSEFLDAWTSNLWNSFTYILLKEGTDTDQFQQKIQEQIGLAYSEDGASRIKQFLIQPITKINLGETKYNENGEVMPGIVLWFLLGFTAIITLIACFNYISLTVSRALNRGKEVGVRKVHGAFRSSVIKQFIVEAVMIALFALLFAYFLVQWLIPEFNGLFFMSFMETKIDASMLLEPYVLGVFIAFTVLLGVIAGFYPALYLSAFNPAEVLKGVTQGRRISSQMLKKIITVGQFSFSIIFISTSLLMYLQFQHLVQTDYGFNQDSVINIKLRNVNYQTLRDKLMQDPNVQSVASANLVPATGAMYTAEIALPGKEDAEIEAQSLRVDEHYLEAMELNLIAGRNFNSERRTDSTSAVIVTTDVISQLGFENPQAALGAYIDVKHEKGEEQIVGVVQNFISVDPVQSDIPTVLFYMPDNASFAVVKTKPGASMAFVGGLPNIWKSLDSPYSLSYTFLDEQLRESPSVISFIDVVKVLGLVAAFSIFISCLGLLGLAMYSAENRIKEIGIRKVLGASVNQLVLTLSKEYLWMILIAIAISTPLTWLLNSLWLNLISNKASFGFMIYASGAVIAALLAMFTISTQTFKAAKTNPVSNLRSE